MILLVSSLLPIQLYSAEQKPCSDMAKTQNDLNICADKDLKDADLELNNLYRQILKKYDNDRDFLGKIKNA